MKHRLCKRLRGLVPNNLEGPFRAVAIVACIPSVQSNRSVALKLLVDLRSGLSFVELYLPFLFLCLFSDLEFLPEAVVFDC